jgi:hypothetical protein
LVISSKTNHGDQEIDMLWQPSSASQRPKPRGGVVVISGRQPASRIAGQGRWRS